MRRKNSEQVAHPVIGPRPLNPRRHVFTLPDYLSWRNRPGQVSQFKGFGDRNSSSYCCPAPKKVLSTSHRNTLTKERDKLIKQQAELRAYDEKLRHFADMRITLDLDDGVKVNYGKFGDLLAEVKAVTGGRDEEA